MDLRERIKQMFDSVRSDMKASGRGYDHEIVAVVNRLCKDCFGRGYVRVIVDPHGGENGSILRPCKCVKWKIVDEEKKDER